MQRKRLISLLLLIALAVCLLTVFAFAEGEAAEAGSSAVCTYCNGAGCDECDGLGYVTSPSRLAFSFWALVPPLVAIALALITKEVYSSLFLGILLGCFFYANGSPIIALNALTNDALIAAVADNSGIFIFLVVLGIMVSLINKSGGSAAFGRWAEKNIKTRVGAMLATFVLGILIFVDDYFNCLTVGSVMLPITDRHKISRAKLAYLIDATAAPICMIAPISSWAAAVTGVVEGDQGIALFCRAIPWNYYSLLTFVFIIGLTLMKFDYGPMKLHEMNAKLNGDLYTTGDRVDTALENEKFSDKGRVIDLILPVLVLIASCFIGLLYVGGFWEAGGDYYGNFVMAFGNTDAYVALTWGSLFALVFTVIYFLLRGVVSFKNAMKSIPQGFINMVPAITILVLANALKNVVNGLLGAKFFIGNLMSGAASGLFIFLPAIIFLVGCVLSFSTGTSWGTFGILIPIVSVMFTPDTTLFYIAISACLAGAVFGDHCSPISDTTIMASAGAMCNHVNHVSTQLPYALTVGAICFVNYILAGLIQNVYLCIVIGIVLTVAVLFILRALNKDSQKQAA
ncbi:MAG: Na+/H+ antiporter NhaC family protein [Oscillospiraceae bacterium]|nr:Na+/H+ antiporter NhaC family protein [Oscillospiraceae bacterium]